MGVIGFIRNSLSTPLSFKGLGQEWLRVKAHADRARVLAAIRRNESDSSWNIAQVTKARAHVFYRYRPEVAHGRTTSALSVDSNADVYATKRCWPPDYLCLIQSL